MTELPWYDRLSDRFNAILVKESRQALKSRQFVATFLLLLAIAWVVSVFGLLNSGAALEFGPVGRDFFYYFYIVLAFAAVVIVPFGAFRSLQIERELNTYDLLSITALKPRQIVWGKLLSAGVQLFLFYSAITPFMAFASLLQGFNTATAGVVLLGTMLVSLLLCMAALMLSSFARHKLLQGLLSALLLVSLASSYFWLVGIVYAVLLRDVITLTNPDFWWGSAFAVLATASYFVLFQQVAVAQLTFESDNRSTGVRVVCAAQFWLLWLVVGLYWFVQKTPPTPVVLSVLAGFSALHWGIAGLVFATEGDFLSRRVRRGIPRNRLLRGLVAPLLPGGARGYLLALLHLAALWIIIVVFQALEFRPAGMTFAEYCSALPDLQSAVWNRSLRIASVLCGYGVIFVGIAAALARWGRAVSNDVKAAHIRVITLLLFVAGIIFPLILRATEAVKQHDYTIFDITSPPVTCEYLTRHSPAARVEVDWSAPVDSLQDVIRHRGYADVIVLFIGAIALLAVLFNVPALVRSVWNLKPLNPLKPPATERDGKKHTHRVEKQHGQSK